MLWSLAVVLFVLSCCVCDSKLYGFDCFFFVKQKTAYEMRISDWSSDVCSSDLMRQVSRISGTSVDISRGMLRTATPGVKRLRRPQIGRASCRERVCQYV